MTIFIIVSAPYKKAENGSDLMKQFQQAIVCHQRIKIGKDIEL